MAATILIVINSNTGETLAFLKWQKKLNRRIQLGLTEIYRSMYVVNAKWTWKNQDNFLLLCSHIQ